MFRAPSLLVLRPIDSERVKPPMEEPLSATARIVPLLSLCIKLVAGALDETTTTNRGVVDQLKALQGDLEGLEKQVLLVQTNLGVLTTGGRDQHTWKLLQGYALLFDTFLSLEALTTLFYFPEQTASKL